MKHQEMQVSAIRDVTETIREFHLVASDGSALAAYTPGAHISIDIPKIGTRHYSLVFPAQTGAPYVIATQREDNGRGGSRWMHENLQEGSRIAIGAPRNNFPLVDDAESYLLIAGGIGLTPLLCMAQHLRHAGRRFTLLASARSWERLPYRKELLALQAQGMASITIDGGDPGEGIDIERVMADLSGNTHVYCCGPNPMMQRVRRAETTLPPSHIHFEAFSAAPEARLVPAAEFDVQVDGKIIHIAANESILSALGRHGIEVDSSCGEGYCGSCLTRYTSGMPIHRDTVMSEDERCRYVAVCTARAQPGSTLVLDL